MVAFDSLNPFASSPNIVSEISDLRVYPIKSCRGISLRSTYLTRQGLDLDRRWMFVDAKTNEFITIRQISKLTLIDTALENGADTSESGKSNDLQLVISVKGTNGRISIPARPSQEWLKENTRLETVKIWDNDTDGYVYNESYNKIFSEFLEKEVALVYKGPTPRGLGGNGAPRFLGRTESVNFPDVLPLQIANEASIHELNQRLTSKGISDITIERFRPNIIIRGATSPDASDTAPSAWTEDSWKTARISDPFSSSSATWLFGSRTSLDIDVVARCARCQVPNVDPDTAEKHKKEPWDTLVSYRRVDEGIKFKPCFGMLSCPRNEGPIAVGMKFEVTETTNKHYYQKGF